MIKSRIEFRNGKPYISINGECIPALAYTTYFEECGEFSDFIKHGYRMFFVNISFTDLAINNTTGFSPFRIGVFENETPDYSEFDGIVRSILEQNPDALIFPRINIAMPRNWLAANPYETVNTAKGGPRESLMSEAFRRDGAVLLKKLVSHIRQSDYSYAVAGYQICGGTTQEWMHHDLFGSFSEMGLEKYKKRMKDKYGITDAPVPSRTDFDSGVLSEATTRYSEFCCEEAARTVEHFVKILKEYIHNEQIAGVFYGYNAFVTDCLSGLHGLRFIIDSPYIDFFSSPCCYDDNRNLGLDWGDMFPVDSVKLHGKLSFIECDIRTYLTKAMQDSRPGKYLDDIMKLTDKNGNKTVWCGPGTPELSVSAIRKAFAHQLTKASGIWWFDMWGGWYHDEKIMNELELMKNTADESKNKAYDEFPRAETVLFIDESAYLNIPRGNYLRDFVNNIRVAMGNTGIPFDMYMVEDAPEVITRYRVAIFPAPRPSDAGKEALKICKKHNIPYIHADETKPFFTTNGLREILVSLGVHCYNSDNCVIYAGGGYLGIHSVKDGKICITLPEKFNVKPLFGTDINLEETDRIILDIKKHDTIIFELLH